LLDEKLIGDLLINAIEANVSYIYALVYVEIREIMRIMMILIS